MLRVKLLVLFVLVINFLNSQIVDSQKLPWTTKCELTQSEAEMGICLSSSCKEANVYFDKVYNTLFKQIQTELKKAKKGTPQFDILSKYISNLPRLKKSLSENALSLSELESAAEISGSGYEIFKNQRYLKAIENNITVLKNLQSDLPAFN